MTNEIATIFGALGELMGLCPCCGELFYVSEARPFYDGQRPVSALDRLAERMQDSIAQAIKRGNVEFRTLRVDSRGGIS